MIVAKPSPAPEKSAFLVFFGPPADSGRRLNSDSRLLAVLTVTPRLLRRTTVTTNEAAQRLLLDSVRVRFPVTDSWGLGGYRNIAIYDLNSGQQVFRKGIPFKSAIAISPDAHLVAVEEEIR